MAWAVMPAGSTPRPHADTSMRLIGLKTKELGSRRSDRRQYPNNQRIDTHQWEVNTPVISIALTREDISIGTRDAELLHTEVKS